MSAIHKLSRAVRNPKLLARKANELYHNRLGTHQSYPGGIDFFDQDWDNLLILDACRYDTFERVVDDDLPGCLSKKRSNASSTGEWLQNNFNDKDLQDTVYVTANPQYAKRRSDLGTRLFKHVPTWEGDEEGVYKGQSIHPNWVAEKARDTAEMYPDKRLIVHFVQPHCPFIGSTGSETFPECPYEDHLLKAEYQYDGVFEEIRAAYEENLRLAVDPVKSLLGTLGGRTVVTADHGQLLGERVWPVPIREVAHPANLYVPALLDVPWLVSESGERKSIVKGSTADTEIDSEGVDERLRALGYHE